jgi:uncharacterized cupredoxin-like copper-binding protein
MRKPVLALLFVAALASGACSSGGGGGIDVDLGEFSLKSAESSAPAGEVTFNARNAGAVEHELIVLKTNLDPSRLKTKDSVAIVEGPDLEVVGHAENIAASQSQELAVTLEPGRYVLLCNIPAHYQSGMRAGFRAT